MPGLADQLTEGSIASLEAAAPWRHQDAKTLESSRRYGAALYVYGFVAEIRLCCACYRALGLSVGTIIADEKRRAYEREARKLNLMGREPHHILGWARYLVHVRSESKRQLQRRLSEPLLGHTEALYEQWRPRLRYKALTPTGAQLQIVREAVQWLDSSYNALWS